MVIGFQLKLFLLFHCGLSSLETHQNIKREIRITFKINETGWDRYYTLANTKSNERIFETVKNETTF